MSKEEEQPRRPITPRALIGQEIRALLSRLARLAETETELVEDDAEVAPDSSRVPVLADGRPTGWQIVAPGGGVKKRLAARVAAQIVGAQIAAETDTSERPEGEGQHQRRLNFLYEMSQSVGALLDEQEICDFVVERVAWLMDSARASLMLYDPESDALKIRASVGISEEIVATTAVKPGESISGKVFETGNEVFIGAGDDLPSESLGLRDLSDAPSFLSVPLTIPPEVGEQQQIIGVINLTRKTGGEAFTTSDHKLGAAVAAHTAAQIRNCRLITAEHERRQLERELQMAAEIQLSLLPKGPLRAGRVEVAGVSRPARHAGGDFFDYWEDDGKVCLVVADVSGHDMGAALLATAFRSAVRTESNHRESLGQRMYQVNRGISPDLIDAELLVTAVYLELELDSGLLTYVSCGHPRPFVLRQQEEVWLRTVSPVLGIDEEAVFEEQTLRLESGDVLVVYTDGVVEAGATWRDQFGQERLCSAARAGPRGEPLALARHIMEAVEEHLGASDLNDDVTVLVASFGA